MLALDFVALPAKVYRREHDLPIRCTQALSQVIYLLDMFWKRACESSMKGLGYA